MTYLRAIVILAVIALAGGVITSLTRAPVADIHLVEQVDSDLDDESSSYPSDHLPGRVTLRRLNRSEYLNTVRELVGVTVTTAEDFLADDTGDGFDTNADVLSVSPLLIEKYLASAESIVDAAQANTDVWKRLTTPPAEDFVPFVMRGNPPLSSDAVKGHRIEPADDKAAQLDQAFQALRAFADRAFRRPATHAELGRLMRFVESAVAEDKGIDAGFKLALTTILVSPHFLFRVEFDPPTGSPTRRLNDHELATRLSYFLWSSLPDEELFRLAAAGKLTAPRTLVAQVRRMLRDPMSLALAENFAGLWLQTRMLSESTRDPIRFPNFDAELRAAMQKETELFFDDLVREDRRILDLLTGEYTFVNNRLAKHYNLANVQGDHFRRVSLAGTGRAGILTHASILTVTSSLNRTSPVKRGKWVLETILGTPPQPPPPGVDGFQEVEDGTLKSVRERLIRHRTRPECASCHDAIDPLGFGLEHFDSIGAWRDRDGMEPIDASGTMPDGREFRGAAELRAMLADQPTVFVRCLTEKLLTYALGRSLRVNDKPTVDRIVQHTVRGEYKFSSLLIAIVRSNTFLMRGAK